MFEKIIFITKEGLNLDEVSRGKLNEIIGEKEVEFIKFKDLKKAHMDDNSLVVTLGGDGTFVKAANLIEDGYIIGINFNPGESEGALTNLNFFELHRLKEVLEGNFEVVQRHRIKVILNGKLLEELALNEVYVGAYSQFHSSRYKIRYNGSEEEHRSSGIIISTGTGSPAWFYSAGGEVFSPDEEKISFVIREPYFGKRVFIPKILKGDLKRGEKLVVESKRDFGGLIAINETTYDFNNGDVVELEISEKPLRTIKLK